MLRNWLTGISVKEISLIFVGAAALMWAIWCTCNDLIFQKKMFTSFTRLSSEEHNGCILDLCYRVRIQKKTICLASKALEMVALNVFAKNGWRSNNRLCFQFYLSQFVYSSLYFISLCAENFVKIWMCAAAEAGDVSFIYKNQQSARAARTCY